MAKVWLSTSPSDHRVLHVEIRKRVMRAWLSTSSIGNPGLTVVAGQWVVAVRIGLYNVGFSSHRERGDFIRGFDGSLLFVMFTAMKIRRD